MMHIRANSSYHISGGIFNTIIPFFTDFVFLFMIISAFGLCCGYYEKFTANQIDIASFYERRYQKVWTYFAMMVLLGFMMEPSIATFQELVANPTLVFGLLPNHKISVIGVGGAGSCVSILYVISIFLFPDINKKTGMDGIWR